MKYEIINYEVWGNAREGFEVNAAYYTGIEVEIDDPWNASDYSINRKIGARGVTYDGDPAYGLYAENKRNGRPEFELQPISSRIEQSPKPIKLDGGIMTSRSAMDQ